MPPVQGTAGYLCMQVQIELGAGCTPSLEAMASGARAARTRKQSPQQFACSAGPWRGELGSCIATHAQYLAPDQRRFESRRHATPPQQLDSTNSVTPRGGHECRASQGRTCVQRMMYTRARHRRGGDGRLSWPAGRPAFTQTIVKG